MELKGERYSGILMPLFSLPSPYGIGTLGKSAYHFIDFLEKSGQKYWQILPLGPTSYGDSPYQSLSSFAGNPYFIDLDLLIEEGLLTSEDVNSKNWGSASNEVDYGAIYNSRYEVLHLAFVKGKARYDGLIKDFREKNAYWIEDWAIFFALKKHFGMKGLASWNDHKALLRDKDTLEKYRVELKEDIEFNVFIQFLFFRQWNALRTYAKSKNIGIIGDIPIYVAPDSQDVWASPEFFQLDENCLPKDVSGVPPDYFNADGQLWGNPLYDWDKMKADGFSWWKKRIEAQSKLYDMLRFDHFRGLESYYTVKFGATTAREGRWVKGPGRNFVDTLNVAFPNIKFTAEDLGYLTEEVIALLKASGWPGMKVLQFAFDSREAGDYNPKHYPYNSVCFTGTHDNTTLKGWIDEVDNAEGVENAMKTLGVSKNELLEAIIKCGMESSSFLMIVPLQDWLGLGAEARINTPGFIGGNWKWRLNSQEMLSDELAAHIKSVCAACGR